MIKVNGYFVRNFNIYLIINSGIVWLQKKEYLWYPTSSRLHQIIYAIILMKKRALRRKRNEIRCKES